MSSCPITGTAEIHVTFPDFDGTKSWARELEWGQADPAIHISTQLLDTIDDDGMTFLTERYELGEWCPHNPFARHARRKDAEPYLSSEDRAIDTGEVGS